jgi:hypothetical protein
MSELIKKVTVLLKEVELLQKHQKEIEIIKGETFNIFSILGVESKENKTHSSFIAELLNPNGSHYMNAVFLEAFLKEINYKGNLDIASTTVHKEFHIAQRKDITGGRIDILIKDRNNNFISIENKIYAGDQENQLIRYHNYKKGKNTLYYLSLEGGEASEHSTVHKKENNTIIALKNGADYYTLSYVNDILNWLDKCHKLAVDVPQLRDSIKQYILLIKKLTNQMIDPQNIAIKKILLENAEAAQFVSENFQKVKNEIKEKFRETVVFELKQKLDSTLFGFAYPNKVNTKGIAQIFVELKKLEETKFQFLIESFSGYGHHNGSLFIGVLDHSNKQEKYPLSGELDGFNTKWWKNTKFILIDNKRINLEDNIFLKKLIDPTSKEYQRIVQEFVSQCICFVNENYTVINDFFHSKSILKNEL